jgi:ATP-binding protein involved in chromosome partitioning
MQAIKNLEESLREVRNIVFNNGERLESRMSNLIIKNSKDIGFSIDISNIAIEDARRVKAIAEKFLSKNLHIGNITVIFTDEKNSNVAIHSKNKILPDAKSIAISSGKGGVGKSTFTVALAKRLADQGKKVGIVDLDIYGPSIPTIFGINNKVHIQHGLMVPMECDNIKIISIGFLVNEIDPIAWRGPMISKILHQLLFLTLWGKIDYLLIDTPPGTGDVHISLLEKYDIDSSLIITNPDKLSVADVKKTIALYKKFNLNMIGIVENNSFFISPETGTKFNLFGSGGAEELAKSFDINLLEKIPTICNFDIHKDFKQIISEKLLEKILQHPERI